MAKLIVLASGNGSNFQAIAEYFTLHGIHEVSALITDQLSAYAIERAKHLAISYYVVPCFKKDRTMAEKIMESIITLYQADLIALAGYMRILSPYFVAKFRGRIINIHPSLLPHYPGSNSIERAFQAGEQMLGITIHYVDEGVDTGTVIVQKAIVRAQTLELMTEAIHQLEHETYPQILHKLLDSLAAK